MKKGILLFGIIFLSVLFIFSYADLTEAQMGSCIEIIPDACYDCDYDGWGGTDGMLGLCDRYNNFDCDDETIDDPVGITCPSTTEECDSSTATCAICIHPFANEICGDAIDNNCDFPRGTPSNPPDPTDYIIDGFEVCLNEAGDVCTGWGKTEQRWYVEDLSEVWNNLDGYGVHWNGADWIPGLPCGQILGFEDPCNPGYVQLNMIFCPDDGVDAIFYDNTMTLDYVRMRVIRGDDLWNMYEPGTDKYKEKYGDESIPAPDGPWWGPPKSLYVTLIEALDSDCSEPQNFPMCGRFGSGTSSDCIKTASLLSTEFLFGDVSPISILLTGTINNIEEKYWIIYKDTGSGPAELVSNYITGPIDNLWYMANTQTEGNAENTDTNMPFPPNSVDAMAYDYGEFGEYTKIQPNAATVTDSFIPPGGQLFITKYDTNYPLLENRYWVYLKHEEPPPGYSNTWYPQENELPVVGNLNDYLISLNLDDYLNRIPKYKTGGYFPDKGLDSLMYERFGYMLGEFLDPDYEDAWKGILFFTKTLENLETKYYAVTGECMDCIDNDNDYYGVYGSPTCGYEGEDCEDDVTNDPAYCSQEPCASSCDTADNCNLCARCINPGAYPGTGEDGYILCQDGKNNDCESGADGMELSCSCQEAGGVFCYIFDGYTCGSVFTHWDNPLNPAGVCCDPFACITTPCIDGDRDGHARIDPMCPSGDDCDDETGDDDPTWNCPLGPLDTLDPNNPCNLDPSLSECAICINPDAKEHCTDEIDNNCNGDVDCDDLDPLLGCVGDIACPITPCIDNDNDGYGSPATMNCPYSELDCDDETGDDPIGVTCPSAPIDPLDPNSPCYSDPSFSTCAICINPGIIYENCYDGVDNNCNCVPSIDCNCDPENQIPPLCIDCSDLSEYGCGGVEGCQEMCIDFDGDGYGQFESPITTCLNEGIDCVDDPNGDDIAWNCPAWGETDGCIIPGKSACAICINPGVLEDCYDDIDNNCNEQCDYGECTSGEPADIHCESPQTNPNYFFPEGIYNVHPEELDLCEYNPPIGVKNCLDYDNDARNFKFGFSIITYHVTAPAGSTVGCTISQSNCQSDQIAGCNRLTVEGVTTADLTDGVFGESGEVSHIIDAADSVERQIIEGGDTVQQWIPWEIDECYVKNPAGIDIRREPVNWRIHVHSINDQNTLEWTSNEVHFADFCWLGEENNLFFNTIQCDFEGDVDVALKYRQGTGIESYCHDGEDNDGDTLSNSADSDCWGITYSWLPKKDIADERTCTSDADCVDPKVCLDGFCSYSPSGSVQLATASPPADGNVRQVTSSPQTKSINILWTEHVNPNNDGKFKIRFRRWDIGNGILGVIADGFPKIEVVKKYGPGLTIDYGLLPYFSAINVLTGKPEYVPRNMLDQTDLAYVTHDNKFIMQSTLSDENIAHLDTTVEVEFSSPSIDQLYNIDLTIVYTTPGGEVNNNYITIPVYFCTDSECPGLDNMNEKTVDLSTTDWKTCSDEKNNDFDYLNKEGNEQRSFADSSYDCYDTDDCEDEIGTLAYNAYTGTYTGGPVSNKVCSKGTELGYCDDSYNNDWYMEDLTNGHQNTDSEAMLPDCRDVDCNTGIGPADKFGNPAKQCEYNIELTCNDDYDNDHYDTFDCYLETVTGSLNYAYVFAEYDCADDCRIRGLEYQSESYYPEQCLDGIDNDWDLFERTDWNPVTAGPRDYDFKSGGGMDCAWTANHPDYDCDGVIIPGVGKCELDIELTCDDSFDNDFDNGYTERAGWGEEFYEEYFGMEFAPNADCDDYNGCKDSGLCPTVESQFAKWCFDDADNDLDKFDDGGGVDCGDPDCIGVVNPDNILEICTRDEYSISNPIRCFDGQDNDADGNGNPSDPQGNTDCYDNTVDENSPEGSLECNKNHPFSPGRNWCAPCAAVEMTNWSGCADGFDNDYDIPSRIIDCDDSDCYMQVGDYDHHFCEYNGITRVELTCDDGFDNDGDGNVDCADSDCSGETGKDGQTCSASENCNDDGDNDGDGAIDCQDSGCYSSCQLDYKSGGDYSPKSTSATFGIVDATWSERVRDGNDYTIRFSSDQSYDSIQIIIGSATGSDRGINLAPPYDGLDVDSVNGNIESLSGDKDKFLPPTVTKDASGNYAAISIFEDPNNADKNGFDVTLHIPTTGTYQRDALINYGHTIYFEEGGVIDSSIVTDGTITAEVLDAVDPIVNRVVVEPPSPIKYSGTLWVGVDPQDAANSKLPSAYDGAVQECIISVRDPDNSATQYTSNTCKFNVPNIVKSGTYTIDAQAKDSVGNVGPIYQGLFVVNTKPVYVADSFATSEKFYTSSESVSVEAEFNLEDSSGASCTAFYKGSGEADFTSVSLTPNPSGNSVLCSGSIPSMPSGGSDDIYEVYVELTKGATVKSGSETYYVCDSYQSSGVGLKGEKWDCKFRDENNDRTPDLCPVISGYCGDGLCVESEGEDCSTCEADCGVCPDSCFPAGTLITYADGSYKPIEDVAIGDVVLGYDTETKEFTKVVVLELESPIRDDYYIISFEDGLELEITDEHPVYARNDNYQGWSSIIPEYTYYDASIVAQKLQIGDELLREDKSWIKITDIVRVEEKIKTYNLKSVSVANTFFANGFLAHNKGPNNGGGGGGGDDGGGSDGPECINGKTKACGTQLGVCKNAVKTCIKREWSECSVVPSLERCNGFDDDCDGIISNVLGFTTVEESSCWCVLGAEPQEEEVCNGIDDDCNSIIDDNANCCLPKELRECGPQEAGIGVCKRGTSTCGGSMLWGECVGAVFPREEICSNELDDDCDGVVDNGCSDLESNAVLILAVTTALMIIFAPLGLIPTTRKKRITQPPKPMARPSPPKIAPKPKVPPKLQYSYTTGVKRKLLR